MGSVLIPLFWVLKIICFQPKAAAFIQAKHQVHVLYCLATGALQQVIHRRVNHDPVTLFFELDHAFVVVDSLF